MITLREVKKSFNAGRPNEFTAIHGITLAIEANLATVFKGPSGSGKTTLLSMIGCMARPSSGRIWLQDQEITSLPERFLTDIRRRRFGFIFQQFNLIKGITALENAMLPAFPIGESYRAIKERALHLFALLGIAPKAHSKAEWLSGGEAQRVAIARAMMNDPSVIIADEPTAHLDKKQSLEFMEIMGRLKDERRTLLFASHDPLVYESAVIDRIVNLRDGKIEET